MLKICSNLPNVPSSSEPSLFFSDNLSSGLGFEPVQEEAPTSSG